MNILCFSPQFKNNTGCNCIHGSDVFFLSFVCVCVFVSMCVRGNSIIIPDKLCKVLEEDNVYCATDPGIKSVPCVTI